MGLSKKYRKSLTKQWNMRFKLRHPDGDCYDGIVTHIKPKFVALAEITDFEFDGTQILLKKFIANYRDGKYEKCSNELLRENGQITKLQPLAWLDECETIRAVLGQLHERDIWPGVKTLSRKDSGFYLGPITEVKRKYFTLYCYDAAGRWETTYQLKYKDICRISIDDRYCRNFNAYMREGWQPEG